MGERTCVLRCCCGCVGCLLGTGEVGWGRGAGEAEVNDRHADVGEGVPWGVTVGVSVVASGLLMPVLFVGAEGRGDTQRVSTGESTTHHITVYYSTRVQCFLPLLLIAMDTTASGTQTVIG